MNKKVLVMGGSYFIGKKIVDMLLEHNYEVYTLNRGTKPVSDAKIVNLICDRNNTEMMKSVLKNHKFSYVIDVSCLKKSQSEILCNALETEVVDKFLFISSSAVYDIENVNIPIPEDASLKENKYWTFYGQNKIEAEEIYKEYFRNRNTGLIILRPPYVYGENNYVQRESFVFDHIEKGRPIILPSENTRLQFIYTTDLANITVKLLETNLKSLEVFNVGNKKSVTFREWISYCEKIAKKPAKVIIYDYKKDNRNERDFFPFFHYDNVLDVTKIHNIVPDDTNFEEGLEKAYQWYCENRNKIEFKKIIEDNETDILRKYNYL